jgi:cellulose biosynthesis protein BcsQ
MMGTMRVIAVTGLKGGVGKTSTAVNLAALAAAEGKRTILWDLDPQGAATYCLNLKQKLKGGATKLLRGTRDGLATVARTTDIEGLAVVPADSSVREVDKVLWASSKPTKLVRRLIAGARNDADLVVIDCPPGLSPVVEAVANVADVLVVPVVPEPLPFRALARYEEFLTDTKAASPTIVAPFLSMVDRSLPMHRRIEAEVRESGRYLAAAIPTSSAVARMGEEQVPAVLAAPRSLATSEYRKLWAELTERAGL